MVSIENQPKMAVTLLEVRTENGHHGYQNFSEG
jgi:hypothetical protein